MNNKYEDIINLSRPMSSVHKPMSISNRAAQFAPFSALSGYKESIEEEIRLTEKKIDISEELKEKLDEKLRYVQSIISFNPKITIKYFIKDKIKAGGKYVDFTSNVKKIDSYNKKLIFDNNYAVNIDDIISIVI